jgi:hypothetical protein
MVWSIQMRRQLLGDQVSHLPRPFLIRVGGEVILRPLGKSSLAPELRLEAAVRTQDLNPLVSLVGHVDVSLRVHGDPGGSVELAVALPRLAEAGKELSLWRKLLDPVIAPVRHVHLAFRAYYHSPGHVKWVFLGAVPYTGKYTRISQINQEGVAEV